MTNNPESINRDDLDGLYDDETIVEDPDIRRAKTLLAGLVVLLGGVFITVLVLFFGPEGQIILERWPNGYRKSQTNYVSAPNKSGRQAHGLHRAWHENGSLAEQGRFEKGTPVGVWEYWDKHGVTLARQSPSQENDSAQDQ